ncbi:MAG: aminotransferase class V-fold PLP-dependent enzyme [Pseudomonadota bacterium]
MSLDPAIERAGLPPLDIDWVRAQFPAFATPSAETEGLVFMENAGGSYTAGTTIDRLTRFYTGHKVQPYGPYAAAARAGAEMDDARARLAALMGVETDEVLFGPSTTQNVYVLAQAVGAMLAEGDEIVVTDQDHEANTGAWRRLADRGIAVREWGVEPETGHLDPAGLAALLTGRTRLVAMPHASNIVAEGNPVAEIAAMVHDAGAWLVVDGVSAAPHGIPDADALGADAYLFSAYKTWGPHQGVMVLRRAFNAALPNQGHVFNDAYPEKRMVPAGPDHAQVAAMAGVADYIDAVHDHHLPAQAAPRDRARAVAAMMRTREKALLARLMAYLETRADLRVLGPTDPARRHSTVAMVHARPAAELAEALAPHGIGAGGSDFYSPRVIRAMGADPDHGVLRLSFLHYTTEAEIDRVIDALDRVL